MCIFWRNKCSNIISIISWGNICVCCAVRGGGSVLYYYLEWLQNIPHSNIECYPFSCACRQLFISYMKSTMSHGECARGNDPALVGDASNWRTYRLFPQSTKLRLVCCSFGLRIPLFITRSCDTWGLELPRVQDSFHWMAFFLHFTPHLCSGFNMLPTQSLFVLNFLASAFSKRQKFTIVLFCKTFKMHISYTIVW